MEEGGGRRVQRPTVGYCLRASYAICTARSTPQQNPYASASLSVTSSFTYENPLSRIFDTSPPVPGGEEVKGASMVSGCVGGGVCEVEWGGWAVLRGRSTVCIKCVWECGSGRQTGVVGVFAGTLRMERRERRV